jgi:hypothetical protein
MKSLVGDLHAAVHVRKSDRATKPPILAPMMTNSLCVTFMALIVSINALNTMALACIFAAPSLKSSMIYVTPLVSKVSGESF